MEFFYSIKKITLVKLCFWKVLTKPGVLDRFGEVLVFGLLLLTTFMGTLSKQVSQ